MPWMLGSWHESHDLGASRFHRGHQLLYTAYQPVLTIRTINVDPSWAQAAVWQASAWSTSDRSWHFFSSRNPSNRLRLWNDTSLEWSVHGNNVMSHDVISKTIQIIPSWCKVAPSPAQKRKLTLGLQDQLCLLGSLPNTQDVTGAGCKLLFHAASLLMAIKQEDWVNPCASTITNEQTNKKDITNISIYIDTYTNTCPSMYHQNSVHTLQSLLDMPEPIKQSDWQMQKQWNLQTKKTTKKMPY